MRWIFPSFLFFGELKFQKWKWEIPLILKYTRREYFLLSVQDSSEIELFPSAFHSHRTGLIPASVRVYSFPSYDVSIAGSSPFHSLQHQLSPLLLRWASVPLPLLPGCWNGAERTIFSSAKIILFLRVPLFDVILLEISEHIKLRWVSSIIKYHSSCPKNI